MALKKTSHPGIYQRQSKRDGLVFDVVANGDGRQQWRRGFRTLKEARIAKETMAVELRKGRARKQPKPEMPALPPQSIKRRSRLAELVSEKGWSIGTELENRVSLAFSALGVLPNALEQEFRLGPYRIDFAFPLKRIAVEVDGIMHTTRKGIENDRARDKALASWGWEVRRLPIDDLSDEELMAELADVLLRIAPST